MGPLLPLLCAPCRWCKIAPNDDASRPVCGPDKSDPSERAAHAQAAEPKLETWQAMGQDLTSPVSLPQALAPPVPSQHHQVRWNKYKKDQKYSDPVEHEKPPGDVTGSNRPGPQAPGIPDDRPRASKGIRMSPPHVRPLALELCAGHAGYTAALYDHGFEAIGVDWQHNQHDSVIPVMSVDLSSQTGQDLIMRIIDGGRVKYVHMGPPCGTASRARDKRVPAWLRKRGAPDPKPLRSDKFP